MGMNETVESRHRTCPGCNAPTVSLPLFTTRRRRPITCTNCGARLERVLPGVPYYALSFITALLLEAALPIALILVFFRQWVWVGLIVAGLLAINLAVSAFLNARTRVEYANLEDARADKPGRSYPN